MFQFQNFNIKKGQSAMEFVILVMAVFFIFIGFLFFIQGKISDTQRDALSVAVNEVALNVQSEMNLARNSAYGYSRNFKLPPNLNGHNYQANIIEKSIYVRADDGKHAVALPVGDVTGDIIIGNNLVRNENGIVYLNQ